MKRRAAIFLSLLTGATLVFVLAGAPGLWAVPGWFYGFWAQEHAVAALGAAAVLALPWLVGWAMGRVYAGRVLLPALALFVASVGLQFAIVGVGGVEALWNRHAIGHAGAFFPVAKARRPELGQTLLGYEELARAGKLGAFGATKPPGTLLSYAAIVELGEQPAVRWALAPLIESAKTDRRIAPYAEAAAVSALLMPVTTAATLFPLLLLGWALLSDRSQAFAAGVVHASAPSVALISYHLDGALFPLLGTSALALIALGVRRDWLWLTPWGGVLLGLGLYFSFSLVPLIGLGVGVALVIVIERKGREGFGAGAAFYRLAWQLLMMAVGLLAALHVLSEELGFDLWVRMDTALAAHAHWKRAVPTELWRGMAVVEFGLYVGVPLFALWLWRSARAVSAFLRRRADAADLFAAGFLALFVALAATAGTNEVARMWLFLVPFVALVVASGLGALCAAGKEDLRGALYPLAFAQLLLAVVMRGYQVW